MATDWDDGMDAAILGGLAWDVSPSIGSNHGTRERVSPFLSATGKAWTMDRTSGNREEGLR